MPDEQNEDQFLLDLLEEGIRDRLISCCQKMVSRFNIVQKHHSYHTIGRGEDGDPVSLSLVTTDPEMMELLIDIMENTEFAKVEKWLHDTEGNETTWEEIYGKTRSTG